MVGNGSSNTASGETAPGSSTAGNRAAGRPSAAVYRRRRIVAGVLALLVVIGLVAGITAVANMLRGDEPAAADTTEATIPGPGDEPGGADAPPADPAGGKPAKPGASASPAPDASASPGAAKACPADVVQVSATTDALSYSAGTNPMLTMTVTNNGAEPCEVNVGTSQMEFMITSGSDRIFSSVDCMQASEDLMMVLKPKTVETAKFSWERQRSAPGCAEVPSNPNPGTYMFTARLGGNTSGSTVFDLE